MLKIVLIGRPNVGKSRLANALAERREALVFDSPGVTRDYKEIQGEGFLIIDTPGLSFANNDLAKRMNSQSLKGLQKADLIFLVLDAKEGLTLTDHEIVDWLRRNLTGKQKILVVLNKSEKKNISLIIETSQLGLGDPLAISAEHRLNFGPIYDLIENHKKQTAEPAEKAISLVIVGKPNAGKSTFFNKILGFERMLTGPEAGLTRDSIRESFFWHKQKFTIIDTAGQAKKTFLDLEKISAKISRDEMDEADGVILLVDGQAELTNQDLHILDFAWDKGKFVLICLNKWDLVKEKDALLEELKYRVKHRAFILPISALNGQNIQKIWPQVLKMFTAWQHRITTGTLNQWLSKVVSRHPIPIAGNKIRPKIKYATQVAISPPTIVVFGNGLNSISGNYKMYLEKNFGETFLMNGVPVRINFKDSVNPYNQE